MDDLRVNQSGPLEQEGGNMGDVHESWADDEADSQTSSQTLSHNAKANDVELGHAGPSEQVSRNRNEVHHSCPHDKTDCQDSGQLQLPSNLDNKTTKNVISKDVEMNLRQRGLVSMPWRKQTTLHLGVLAKQPNLIHFLLPQ